MAKNINIIRFNSQHEKQWDNFVASSNNGTLFHLRRFLNYHPPERFNDHSLIFHQENQWLALFPAAERIIDGKKILFSHPGASFGGFVFLKPNRLKETRDMIELLLQYTKSHSFDSVIITHLPQVYLKQPSDYLSFVLQELGFQYKNREISSILALGKSIEYIHEKFSTPCIRAIRKAKKHNITIRMSDDYAAYFEILKNNLSARHNVAPTHSLEEIERLAALFPKRIHLFGAFVEQKLIAGIVMFDVSPQTTLAFYISHDPKFQEFRPVNLLFYHIAEWAIARRFKYLDFGIFTVNGRSNNGLARFKESFGATGIFRDTLEKTLK